MIAVSFSICTSDLVQVYIAALVDCVAHCVFIKEVRYGSRRTSSKSLTGSSRRTYVHFQHLHCSMIQVPRYLCKSPEVWSLLWITNTPCVIEMPTLVLRNPVLVGAIKGMHFTLGCLEHCHLKFKVTCMCEQPWQHTCSHLATTPDTLYQSYQPFATAAMQTTEHLCLRLPFRGQH